MELNKQVSEVVDVHLFGRHYQVSIDPKNRERLIEAVRVLTERSDEVVTMTQVFSLERVAVMVALNITYDMLYHTEYACDRLEALNKTLIETSISEAIS